MSKKLSFFGFFIWTLAVLFYFYEFLLRVLPATVADNIIGSLDLSIEQFAIIASAYYVTYSLMQIPVGILLDRFPARVLITIAVALCSFGALWFSFAHSFIPAFIARLLIGLGSSFGFISLMIVTLNWFPRKYFAFLTGCGQFLGAIGPLVAGGPIALMLKSVHGDWRLIFLWVALFGISLTLLIGIFLKSKPLSQDKILFVDKKDPLLKRILQLLNKKQVWWILAYAASIYVALPILGAFWGTTYLQAKGFSKTSSAFAVSMIWLGLAFGSPLFGRVSDAIHRRKPIVLLASVSGLIGSALIFLIPMESIYFLSFCFFLIGFAGAGQSLSFVLMTEHAPEHLRATALGINNTAIMGFAALMPPFITSIIRHFAVDGQLTAVSFEKGLVLIPAIFFTSLLVGLFGIKETFCRQQNEVHTIEKN